MTYIATEPTEMTVFRDSEGKWHDDRESALLANFEIDLHDAAQAAWKDESTDLVLWLKVMARKHPDMLRILVGDRDYT